jgi:beta/gamma crystallin
LCGAAGAANNGGVMNEETGDCYIEIWEGKHFEGAHLRLIGPADYPSLQLSAGKWGDRVSSLRVGPQAFVLAYEDEEFKDKMVSFGPGQTVGDLSEFSLNDQIDSIRIISSLRILDHWTSENQPATSAQPQQDSTPAKSKGKGRRKRRRR